jgi:hypothetical protein
MHGPFFRAAVDAPCENKRLVAVWTGDQLHFHPCLSFRPVLLGQVLLEVPQHGFRRTDDVLATPLTQERQVVFAHHPVSVDDVLAAGVR